MLYRREVDMTAVNSTHRLFSSWLRIGCASLTILFLISFTLIVLFWGGLQLKFINPPVGTMDLGPMEIASGHEVTTCTTTDFASCPDAYYVVNLNVKETEYSGPVYQIIRWRLR
jgi:hypothetical protein